MRSLPVYIKFPASIPRRRYTRIREPEHRCLAGLVRKAVQPVPREITGWKGTCDFLNKRGGSPGVFHGRETVGFFASRPWQLLPHKDTRERELHARAPPIYPMGSYVINTCLVSTGGS